MKFNKQDIEQALKTITVPGEGQNMIESKAVKNIMVFADEVIVDITISNPSLQAKKTNGSGHPKNHSRIGLCQSKDHSECKSRGSNPT